MGILANENAISSGGYQISNSLRFQSASSQYMSRTPSVSGSLKTWTWSGWMKRGNFAVSCPFINSSSSISNGHHFTIGSDGVISCQFYTGAYNTTWGTQSVMRDPSAWYHICLVWDTTQASAPNMVKIYVNGVSQPLNYATNGSSTIPQNTNGLITSSAYSMLIGMIF